MLWLSHEKFIQLLKDDAPSRDIHHLLLKSLGSLNFRDILSEYLSLRHAVLGLEKIEYIKVLEEVEDRLYALLVEKAVPPTPDELPLFRARSLLAEKEHPEAGPADDKDFKGYLRARSLEDKTTAQKIYSRLLYKYPDLDMRSNLLRFWRKGRGLFQFLYQDAKQDLGRRIEERVKKFISAFVELFSQSNMQTLELMGNIRSAVRILPPSRDTALLVLDRLEIYSRALNWFPAEYLSISKILRSYYEESLFTNRRVTLVLSTPKVKKHPSTVQKIDLQKVNFTPQDIQQILVPPTVVGTTNLTLAYCRKYWLYFNDTSLENKILLYSQKYHSFHYLVFQAIQRGRLRRADDEVIIHNVYSIISKGQPYDYNVRRDFMMQQIWRRIRPQAQMRHTIQEAETKVEAKKVKTKEVKQIKPPKPVKAPKLVRVPKTVRPPKTVKPPQPKKIKKSKGEWEVYSENDSEGHSIMKRILALDTSEQKNLHLIFRRNLESEIEAYVRDFIYIKKSQLKPYAVSLVIISIKNFITSHMESSDSNWMLSNERQEVAELGLDIRDIDPIIDKCFEVLQKRI